MHIQPVMYSINALLVWDAFKMPSFLTKYSQQLGNYFHYYTTVFEIFRTQVDSGIISEFGDFVIPKVNTGCRNSQECFKEVRLLGSTISRKRHEANLFLLGVAIEC